MDLWSSFHFFPPSIFISFPYLTLYKMKETGEIQKVIYYFFYIYKEFRTGAVALRYPSGSATIYLWGLQPLKCDFYPQLQHGSCIAKRQKSITEDKGRGQSKGYRQLNLSLYSLSENELLSWGALTDIVLLRFIGPKCATEATLNGKQNEKPSVRLGTFLRCQNRGSVLNAGGMNTELMDSFVQCAFLFSTVLCSVSYTRTKPQVYLKLNSNGYDFLDRKKNQGISAMVLI